MLTISKPLSAGQARSYHEKEFANAEQNYYSQKGAVEGEWAGKLAAEWGLAGAVGAAEFARRCRLGAWSNHSHAEDSFLVIER